MPITYCDCVALPGKDLQPVSVRRDGEDNKTGVTLDFLQFGFDARDLSIVQKGTNSIVEPRKLLQRRSDFAIRLVGIDADMLDLNIVATDLRLGGRSRRCNGGRSRQDRLLKPRVSSFCPQVGSAVICGLR